MLTWCRAATTATASCRAWDSSTARPHRGSAGGPTTGGEHRRRDAAVAALPVGQRRLRTVAADARLLLGHQVEQLLRGLHGEPAAQHQVAQLTGHQVGGVVAGGQMAQHEHDARGPCSSTDDQAEPGRPLVVRWRRRCGPARPAAPRPPRRPRRHRTRPAGSAARLAVHDLVGLAVRVEVGRGPQGLVPQDQRGHRRDHVLQRKGPRPRAKAISRPMLKEAGVGRSGLLDRVPDGALSPGQPRPLLLGPGEFCSRSTPEPRCVPRGHAPGGPVAFSSGDRQPAGNSVP